LYLAHIREGICSGIPALYEFVVRWMAQLIQHPGDVPEIALVLRGLQGTGKNTFVDTFGTLLGVHYIPVHNMNQVTGRFNGHLATALLVHCNEAIWGGAKEAEGALKSMITDPKSAI